MSRQRVPATGHCISNISKEPPHPSPAAPQPSPHPRHKGQSSVVSAHLQHTGPHI